MVPEFDTKFNTSEINWKGSQLRCLLLTQLDEKEFKKQMEAIIGKETLERFKIEIPDDCKYFPKGFATPEEIQLDKKRIEIEGSNAYCDMIKKWWLKSGGTTPVWDLVCTAKIGGKEGFILVEAKAHLKESAPKNDKCKSKKESRNRNQIKEALKSINDEYEYDLSLTELYQMSNRIAWSVKLASMGIPIVLIYLGFLNAEEMYKKNDPIFKKQEELKKMSILSEKTIEIGKQKISIESFSNGDSELTYVDWEKLVRTISKEVLSFDDWEKQKKGRLKTKTISEPSYFYPLIRTIDIQLEDKPIEAKIYING
ncbi:MAG: hypothetical protein WCY84_03760 [Candidatus Cloacimonadaceae bacterium]